MKLNELDLVVIGMFFLLMIVIGVYAYFRNNMLLMLMTILSQVVICHGGCQESHIMCLDIVELYLLPMPPWLIPMVFLCILGGH